MNVNNPKGSKMLGKHPCNPNSANGSDRQHLIGRHTQSNHVMWTIAGQLGTTRYLLVVIDIEFYWVRHVRRRCRVTRNKCKIGNQIGQQTQRTSSRLMTSIWSFLWKSSHSSLYLSISSLV